MVPLGLLAGVALLLSVWVLRQLRRILVGLLLRLRLLLFLLLLLSSWVRLAVLCRSSARAILLGVVAYVSILLRVLTVRRRRRRQRG